MGSISSLYGAGSVFGNSLQSSSSEDEFWKLIREQFVFPDDYIYLNTGGIGALPGLVLNRVTSTMNAQEKHPRPGHSHENWLETKKICSYFLGPKTKVSELALIGCATEGINIILNGIGLKEGDEVITSTHEHPAVHVPLLNHHRLNKIGLKIFDPDLESAEGNLDRISKLITPKTRLIMLSHITCTTGQKFPIKEIGELAKRRGIIFAVDGAQAPGSMHIDLEDMNVDYYTTSGHKWMLGPKRTGILYVPERNLEALQATTVGAYSDNGYDIRKLTIKLQESAQRYEFGTMNEPLFLGLAAGAQFVKTIGIDKVEAHNRGLAEAFYNGLREMKGVEVLSPKEEKYRSSMISFRIPGKKNRDISAYLGKGDPIRVRVVDEADLNGVRVSFHVYNQTFEVERILNKISDFQKQ